MNLFILLLLCICCIFLLIQMLFLLMMLILINIAVNDNYKISDKWIKASLAISWFCPVLWFDKEYREHYKILKELLRK